VAPFLKPYFALNGTQGDLQLGLAVSALGWGLLGGIAISVFLGRRFDRKSILVVTMAVLALSALISAQTASFPVLVAARVLGGIAAGETILAAPAFTAEISPGNPLRSPASLNQLMILTGIAASFFSNRCLLDVGENNWRWMLAAGAVPAAACFPLLLALPESPRWLPDTGREENARKAHGKTSGENQPETELPGVGTRLAKSPAGHNLGAALARKLTFLILIGLAIAFFQQITGVNAILYYMPGLFIQAGGSLHSAFWQAAVTGLVNLGLTLAALWLVDKIGRKPLLIIGAAGMAAAALTCSWAFNSATYQLTAKSYEMLQAGKVPPDFMADLKSAEGLVFATDKEFLAEMEQRFGADRIKPYRDALAGAALNLRARVVFCAISALVASFAFSLGPVMWLVLPEMFPGQYRGRAMRRIGFWSAAAGAGVTLVFPRELSHLGFAGTFLVCGLFALAALVFIAAAIPSPKGKALEELENLVFRSPAQTSAGRSLAPKKNKPLPIP